MTKIGGVDIKIENLPQLIHKAYPDSEKIGELVIRLESFYPKIFKFVGNGSVFMRNHFKHRLLRTDGAMDINGSDLKFFNPLMEGLWHMHVVWSLDQAGFNLVIPDNDDDIVIELNGQKIAFEVTLSDIDYDYIACLTNDDIVQKMMNVTRKKDIKIRKRASGIPTFIVLNEQRVINDGYRLYKLQNAEYTKRADDFSDKLQNTNLGESIGVIYSNIEYSNFFKKNVLLYPILVGA